MPHACRCWSVVLVLAAGWLASSSRLAAEPPTESWLRGSGRDLEMRLHGEVVDADGKPAEGVAVTGRISTAGAGVPIEATVTGNRFEAWLPVNRVKWQNLSLKAVSGAGVANKQISARQLRQVAIEGMKLTLRTPSRDVAVKVLTDGQPTPDATVKVELSASEETRVTTDEAGVAHLKLLPEQTLAGLMAWKGTDGIGGYSFHATPRRDPAADEFTVELTNTRPQRVRFVDAQGEPVAGVPFVLQVGTAPPQYNYIGTNEEFSLTTDEKGEAVCRHFPDWKESYCYPELDGAKWYFNHDTSEMIDGVLVYTLHPRRERELVRGRVIAKETSPGGFFVSLDSFQGEQEDEIDMLSTFSNADGSYEMDVLPESTYCACAIDMTWASPIVDLIPFQAAANHAAAPELTMVAGQTVDVVATTGPDDQPLANLLFWFHRPHEFNWRENGKKRSAKGGAQWWAVTDAAGRASGVTLPGELKVSAYTPQWRVEEKITVVAGKPAEIRIHRDVAELRAVAGVVAMADGAPVEADQLELAAGSVDSKIDDIQTIACNPAGEFKFETRGEEVAVFGRTKDGRWAGAVVTDDFSSPLQLALRPTDDFAGQLLDGNDQPIANHRVRAYVRVHSTRQQRGLFATFLDAMTVTTRTDAEGRYAFENLPCGIKTTLYADEVAETGHNGFIDDVVLIAGEAREPTVTRLAPAKNNLYTGPLAERYRTLLRDCALSGYHLMVIDGSGDDPVQELIDRNFLDHTENNDVARYMQFVLPRGSKVLTAEDEAFVTAQGWQAPGEGRIAAYALDAAGQTLGKLEIEVAAKGQGAEVTEFIYRHAPPRQDAAKKLADALEEAKQTDRRVWARVSGRYCGPCFLMSRWLDDQRELLEKEFVLVKIDLADLHADEVEKRITDGKSMGIPAHAMFAADGTRIIGSDSPAGNVGHPAGSDGKKHLRKMLLETRQRLTDAEIEQIIASLDD